MEREGAWFIWTGHELGQLGPEIPTNPQEIFVGIYVHWTTWTIPPYSMSSRLAFGRGFWEGGGEPWWSLEAYAMETSCAHCDDASIHICNINPDISYIHAYVCICYIYTQIYMVPFKVPKLGVFLGHCAAPINEKKWGTQHSLRCGVGTFPRPRLLADHLIYIDMYVQKRSMCGASLTMRPLLPQHPEWCAGNFDLAAWLSAPGKTSCCWPISRMGKTKRQHTYLKLCWPVAAGKCYWHGLNMWQDLQVAVWVSAGEDC